MLIKSEIGVRCGVLDCVKLKLVFVSLKVHISLYTWQMYLYKILCYETEETDFFKAGFLNSVVG